MQTVKGYKKGWQKMNKIPEISLIMSVYNGEDYLAEAIESVLNQTFDNFELIVINAVIIKQIVNKNAFAKCFI